METVLAKAGPTEDSSSVHLKYTDTVLGFPVIVGYIFDSGLLEGTVYRVELPKKDPAGYYEAYKKLRLHLVDRYGQPDTIIEQWKDEKYKGDVTKWGLAVSKGHYRAGAKWSSGNTEIMIILAGAKGKIDLAVSANRVFSTIFQIGTP